MMEEGEPDAEEDGTSGDGDQIGSRDGDPSMGMGSSQGASLHDSHESDKSRERLMDSDESRERATMASDGTVFYCLFLDRKSAAYMLLAEEALQ